MTRFVACCALGAALPAFLGCSGGAQRRASPSTPPAIASVNAPAPATTTVAPAPEVATPDADHTPPFDILKAGWIGTSATMFVVDEHGVSRIDDVGEDGRWTGGRCELPPGATFIDASDEGHVALTLAGARPDSPGHVGILDVRTCQMRRTGIPAAFAMSADGSRLLVGGEDDDASYSAVVHVYAVKSGAILATCKASKGAGGGDVSASLTGDGMGIIWRHGRSGTFVRPIETCNESTHEVASGDFGFMVSPHRRTLLHCPYVAWGTSQPSRGFAVLRGKQEWHKLALDALSDDDYGICQGWTAAISHDDDHLAFIEASRLHVVSLASGRERLHTGRLVTREGAERGLAFSGHDDEVMMWESTPKTPYEPALHQLTIVRLAKYEAYLRASITTWDEAEAAVGKAVQIVDLAMVKSAPAIVVGEGGQ
jgi:hypothetical protein